MSPLATIKDVAKKAGVALSTASYALNGSTKISASTREKVLSAAKELNYLKSGPASDLKKNRTKTIALLLSDLSGPFYSELIRGVQEIVLENGYDLIAVSSYADESSTAARFLREARTDGVILLAHNINTDFVLNSAREGFPIIALDREVIGNPNIISISVNNSRGAYEATEHLINSGCRSVAHISGPANSKDSQERLAGYKQALADFNTPSLYKWILNGKFTQEGGYEATKMLIHQGDLPEGIFYGNDEMAIGGLNALKEYEIRVPEDISIIGFDDIQLAPYLRPPLTTMRQPKYEIGKLASHVLFQLLAGESVSSHYTFDAELISRESVRLF
ncbi:LacI family DNA-binding transcriptional regulator [Salisediminibacterium halotolerans]|uniref:LacI family DNA-binding transcriptional regulator n=1 Tax=Salisediminibacterium halotolerans TaxID=517425 RepID=UPI000F10B960|nr:LacI family DNA-binding transcriptional regulator [Salisediminibacterium halotolerans]RLJ72306.1 LacI family transcriptional regulator [Actinophytocola xinjiangensis]RPE85520.1 LacI family transcriptional regulator [Salisediminibacterium halotolerans]TWG33475.1 LacI family transcriptional regulator [Salisediminibacterium halotolerans]GEL07926.1 LacI family transcriptional regulator [Salisediminibacterium halotolerans]